MTVKQLYGLVWVYIISVIACREMGEINVVLDEKDTISNQVRKIADNIAIVKTVDDKSTGLAGIISSQYKMFLNLMYRATNKELLLLTSNSSPNVRAYSFWGLAKKGVNMKPILDSHINDTSNFIFNSGCIIHNTKINNFFLLLLTENYIDSDIRKLDNNEVSGYKKLIEKKS